MLRIEDEVEIKYWNALWINKLCAFGFIVVAEGTVRGLPL